MITLLQYCDELTDLISKRVIRFTPQIFRIKSNTKRNTCAYEPIGSSVLLNVQDRLFLITAGHIIAENKIGNIGFLEDGLFHILDGRFIYLNSDLDFISKYTDLAICELDFESQKFLSKYYDFVNGSKINFDYNPPNSNNFLLVGFPWRKTRFNYLKHKIKVTPFKFLTEIFYNDQLGELNSLCD